MREDAHPPLRLREPRSARWFRLLIAIQGVGPKVALAILGALGADELSQAIAAGDKACVTRAPASAPSSPPASPAS